MKKCGGRGQIKQRALGRRLMLGSRAQLGGSGQQWQMVHLEHFEVLEYIPEKLVHGENMGASQHKS